MAIISSSSALMSHLIMKSTCSEFFFLTRQCSFFGPFPLSYQEIAGEETLAILAYIHESLPPEKQKPFTRLSAKEVSAEDRDFLLKVMKMDPRDKPTAAELLEDDWFRGN